jgi:hypothetical protein
MLPTELGKSFFQIREETLAKPRQSEFYVSGLLKEWATLEHNIWKATNHVWCWSKTELQVHFLSLGAPYSGSGFI